MHVKDIFSKQCFVGAFGILLVFGGASLGYFWADLFDGMFAKVSLTHIAFVILR